MHSGLAITLLVSAGVGIATHCLLVRASAREEAMDRELREKDAVMGMVSVVAAGCALMHAAHGSSTSHANRVWGACMLCARLHAAAPRLGCAIHLSRVRPLLRSNA